MSFHYPWLTVVAILLSGAAVAGYLIVQKRRSEMLVRAGMRATAGVRRHLPYALFLTALPLLLLSLARPQATLDVPRISGTVMLVFDVSRSMAADDVKPSRLAAAQAAATNFVQAQPNTVDIGVVVFGQGALVTQPPTANHGDALAAIKRTTPGGGTSLGHAILASLSAIIGRTVTLPDPGSASPPPDLGYWGSATILLFSDGEDTGGPDVEEAALLAAEAGVRIETIGIGTQGGTTIEVDGFQVATALNDDLLNLIATTTGGTYHPAGDAASLNDASRSIDLRITLKEEPVELTGPLAGVALLLLTVGGLLMTLWTGRII